MALLEESRLLDFHLHVLWSGGACPSVLVGLLVATSTEGSEREKKEGERSEREERDRAHGRKGSKGEGKGGERGRGRERLSG
jgi:hypothetical protein